MTENDSETQIRIMAADQKSTETVEVPINIKIEGIDAQVRRFLPELSSFGACDFLFKVALPITLVLGISMVIAEASFPGTISRIYHDLYNAFVWLKFRV